MPFDELPLEASSEFDALLAANDAVLAADDARLSAKAGVVMTMATTAPMTSMAAMGRTNSNIQKAAELLGVSRPTLYDLMRRLSIK